MRATLKAVNAAVKAAGIPLRLVRGDGYHYWIHDHLHNTLSEMVCYTSHLSVERWVEWAQIALDQIKRENS